MHTSSSCLSCMSASLQPLPRAGITKHANILQHARTTDYHVQVTHAWQCQESQKCSRLRGLAAAPSARSHCPSAARIHIQVSNQHMPLFRQQEEQGFRGFKNAQPYISDFSTYLLTSITAEQGHDIQSSTRQVTTRTRTRRPRVNVATLAALLASSARYSRSDSTASRVA